VLSFLYIMLSTAIKLRFFLPSDRPRPSIVKRDCVDGNTNTILLTFNFPQDYDKNQLKAASKYCCTTSGGNHFMLSNINFEYNGTYSFFFT
jgi:hypothetical protein